MFWIGLLSGTSVDGIDAALVEIDLPPGEAPLPKSQQAFATYPFPEKLRRELLELAEAERPLLSDVLRLDVLLGELFAEAARLIAKAAGVALKDVRAVGSHGQTVRHLPERREETLHFAGADLKTRWAATLQLGDPSVIAERTGITTIGRFRQRDLAAGGQGAPLVPVFHEALLKAAGKKGALLNVGGIANVTLPAGGGRPLQAFDTGPGNMVLDALVQRFALSQEPFDRNGKIASKGSVSEKLLAEFLADSYFERPPPKSTGREAFGKGFANKFAARGEALGLCPEDQIATATALTAASVTNQIAIEMNARGLDHLYVCGGGAHNKALLEMLEARLARKIRVASTEALGYGPDAIEALAFAYLAACHEAGWPGNTPGATGASHPALLGERAPGGGERR